MSMSKHNIRDNASKLVLDILKLLLELEFHCKAFPKSELEEGFRVLIGPEDVDNDSLSQANISWRQLCFGEIRFASVLVAVG